jgi:RNA polymerase-binding transcription factor DksA
MTPVTKRKKALLARLAELETRLQSIDVELESHKSNDWEELAVERESDEVLEGMGLSGQEEIKAITAALQRIEEGEFGYCVTCGSEIAQGRLDVLPYTPFCQACAAKHAKQR